MWWDTKPLCRLCSEVLASERVEFVVGVLVWPAAGPRLCDRAGLEGSESLYVVRPGGRNLTRSERAGKALFLGNGQVGFVVEYERTELKQFNMAHTLMVADISSNILKQILAGQGPSACPWGSPLEFFITATRWFSSGMCMRNFKEFVVCDL